MVHRAAAPGPYGVPICYQFTTVLDHLGFETEVMAAYADVVRPSSGDDFATNGHTVLWSA